MSEGAGTAQTGSLAAAVRRHEDGGPILSLTRIRFRNPIGTLRAWFRFHRLYQRAGGNKALLRSCVAVEDLHTLVNISIWQSRWDMLMWSGHDEHVEAVRWTYRRVTEVWSADWRLAHQSESAQNWRGAVTLAQFPPTGPAI